MSQCICKSNESSGRYSCAGLMFSWCVPRDQWKHKSNGNTPTLLGDTYVHCKALPAGILKDALVVNSYGCPDVPLAWIWVYSSTYLEMPSHEAPGIRTKMSRMTLHPCKTAIQRKRRIQRLRWESATKTTTTTDTTKASISIEIAYWILTSAYLCRILIYNAVRSRGNFFQPSTWGRRTGTNAAPSRFVRECTSSPHSPVKPFWKWRHILPSLGVYPLWVSRRGTLPVLTDDVIHPDTRDSLWNTTRDCDLFQHSHCFSKRLSDIQIEKRTHNYNEHGFLNVFPRNAFKYLRKKLMGW